MIETSRGSRNKLGYDPEIAAFRLKFVLPEGMTFPYDFGFVPATRAEDGDPLDVLVLLDDPVPVGCVVGTRLIGVIEVRQREGENKEWIRNDRLLGVAAHARTHRHIRALSDLRPGQCEEIAAFFKQYSTLNGREFELLGQSGPEAARAALEHAVVTDAK
ncbi:MAG: inorganic diphosphatase [Acetobacteraceae bacterium]|nr:inorganic diphosphatase [Acetobacteraceae bacterium]